LIKPFQKDIAQFANLVFVPYSTLHLLPFHALPFQSEALGFSKNIAYLPSASVLQFLDKKSSPTNLNMLAVGNPTGDLSASELEASFVADLFQATPLLNVQATEHAVRKKLNAANLMHFATHGNLSEEAPLQSSISLANEEELSLYELMGIQLNAELVVLSACNTARGETTGGDDVLGLTRGLLASGAKSVLVSLWAVDDLSTSLFMVHFYKNIKEGKTPSAALLESQVYLKNLNESEIESEINKLQHQIKDEAAGQQFAKARSKRGMDLEAEEFGSAKNFKHPFYWAPFILVGKT